MGKRADTAGFQVPVDEKVTEIDPWRSRPFDVHRWSEHPEVANLIEEIWAEHFQDVRLKRSGPKPKGRTKDMLKVLLLDLYVAWATDPELSLGIHLDEKKWRPGSRYNALHLSKEIISHIHRLHALGLIDLAKGSYGGPGVPTNRISRIRAAVPLKKRFRDATFRLPDIRHTKDQECLILRDENGMQVEYDDSPETDAMRKRLRSYNELLARTFIDVPSFMHPVIERRIDTGPKAGELARVHYNPSDVFVRRVFSRSSWGKNGRFYGGFWQGIGETTRKQIYIDDTPTIEIDYKAMHINILSLEAGVALEGDPYDLTEGFLDGADRRSQRGYLKKLVLTAINARTQKAAFGAFRDSCARGDPGTLFRDVQLKSLLEEFVRRTPQLEKAIFADQGIRLMNVDAQIADRVLTEATSDGIPILCVHDSFIVDYNHSKYLKDLMSRHSAAVVGSPLPVTGAWMGMDAVDGDRKRDYAAVRDIPRSFGYKVRKKRFDAGK